MAKASGTTRSSRPSNTRSNRLQRELESANEVAAAMYAAGATHTPEPGETQPGVEIPQGKRLETEDDYVVVYDSQGDVDYEGLQDYSPYKDRFMEWDEKAKNYKMDFGYRMVVLKRY